MLMEPSLIQLQGLITQPSESICISSYAIIKTCNIMVAISSAVDVTYITICALSLFFLF